MRQGACVLCLLDRLARAPIRANSWKTTAVNGRRGSARTEYVLRVVSVQSKECRGLKAQRFGSLGGDPPRRRYLVCSTFTWPLRAGRRVGGLGGRVRLKPTRREEGLPSLLLQNKADECIVQDLGRTSVVRLNLVDSRSNEGCAPIGGHPGQHEPVRRRSLRNAENRRRASAFTRNPAGLCASSQNPELPWG